MCTEQDNIGHNGQRYIAKYRLSQDVRYEFKYFFMGIVAGQSDVDLEMVILLRSFWEACLACTLSRSTVEAERER